MLVTGIKSKPVYAPLSADAGGRYHVMLGMGAGAGALLRAVEELRSAAPHCLARTHVLLAAEAAQSATAFAPFGLGALDTYADAATLLQAYKAVLDAALMGTRLYVAGPESFIGLAMQIALSFDLNQDEIRAQEIGSLARRVYCVHCRSVAEDVTTNIVRCGGCARWLLVRDHYSRRLAAYMGVMVDAEMPGDLPAVQVIYP